MTPAFHPFFLVLAGVIVGLLAALPLKNYGLLTLSPEVTMGNVFQACATILTGLIVAAYIQRSVHADRKEKDLILRQLDLVLASLDEFERFREGGKLTDITALLKRLAVSCKAAKEIVVFLKYSRSIVDQTKFDSEIKELRKLATETPIKKIQDHAQNALMSSEVREGIIKLAEGQRAKFDAEIQKFRMKVFKGQMCINKF